MVKIRSLSRFQRNAQREKNSIISDYVKECRFILTAFIFNIALRFLISESVVPFLDIKGLWDVQKLHRPMSLSTSRVIFESQ